jgi:hypothetical protein
MDAKPGYLKTFTNSSQELRKNNEEDIDPMKIKMGVGE